MLLSALVYLAVLYLVVPPSIEMETIENLNLKSSNFCSYLENNYYGHLISIGLTICSWCGNIVKSFIRYKLSLPPPNLTPTALFIWQSNYCLFLYIYEILKRSVFLQFIRVIANSDNECAFCYFTCSITEFTWKRFF